MKIKSKIRTEGKGVTKVTGRFVGGTEAATRTTGKGFTVAWTSTGVYTITFAEKYYELIAVGATLQATTPGDLKGHTVIFGVLNTTTLALIARVYDATDTLHDLAALEWLSFEATFRAGSADSA